MKFPASTTWLAMFILPLAALLSSAWMQWRQPFPEDMWMSGEDRIVAAGFSVVSLPTLQDRLAEGSWLLFDARSLKQYDQGHIPGSFPLPVAELEERFAEYAAFFTQNVSVMVYCSGADCKDALDVAMRLRELGLEQIEIFAGGWEVWNAQR